MKNTFTRDELINVLRGWHKAFSSFNKSHERNVQALAQAADMLEQGKWISVKDRLPDTFKNVLVCTKHEMLLCHHDGDEWVINYDGEYAGYDYDITHWMPLPEPLKEEE